MQNPGIEGERTTLESGKEVGPLEDGGENLGTMLKQESTESGRFF